jgi:hypothetical protein
MSEVPDASAEPTLKAVSTSVWSNFLRIPEEPKSMMIYWIAFKKSLPFLYRIFFLFSLLQGAKFFTGYEY